jgi:hypothetical protein
VRIFLDLQLALLRLQLQFVAIFSIVFVSIYLVTQGLPSTLQSLLPSLSSLFSRVTAYLGVSLAINAGSLLITPLINILPKSLDRRRRAKKDEQLHHAAATRETARLNG